MFRAKCLECRVTNDGETRNDAVLKIPHHPKCPQWKGKQIKIDLIDLSIASDF